jgi:Sulfotransferase family
VNAHGDAADAAVFLRMCARLQPSAERRPLVLKNPWDFSNFVDINQALPGARFIFIHRHPERVVQSLLHVGRVLMESKHPYLALLAPEYDRLFARPVVRTFFRVLASTHFDIGARVIVRFVADARDARAGTSAFCPAQCGGAAPAGGNRALHVDVHAPLRLSPGGLVS